MADSYETLRNLPKEQLIDRYNEMARSTQLGLGFYREELFRRESEEQNQRMHEFTRQMRNMTVGITVMTLIVLVLTGLNVYAVL